MVSPEPEVEHVGYAMIGRVIVAFGQLDREMIRLLLETKGPAGISSLFDERVPRYFPLRVAKWVERVRSNCDPLDKKHLEPFAQSLISLSGVRNQLAHNVFSFVAHSADQYTIEIQRLAYDGDSPFRKWVRRLRWKTPPMTLPEPAEPIIITAERMKILARDTDQALERVCAISEACRSVGVYTIPPPPPAGR